MKDILFLIPLYYTPHFIERFRQYLEESRTHYTYDVFLCCSNHDITEEAKQKAGKYGYLFQERENFGGGEGALWFLQKKSGIDLTQYRYIWYFEESCEPIHRDWVNKLIGDMDNGAGLVGWDWHFQGKKRPGQLVHKYKDNSNNTIIAYENTAISGFDTEGNTFNKIWDTPGYRDETFIVKSSDFLEFDYPDASDPFWQKRNGVRGYGVRAEREWWNINDWQVHGFKLPSPNIQWHLLLKYNRFPSANNIYYWYFRELPLWQRKSVNYLPNHILWRYLQQIIKELIPELFRRFNALIKK